MDEDNCQLLLATDLGILGIGRGRLRASGAWARRAEAWSWGLRRVAYTLHLVMADLRLTPEFIKWFSALRDERAQARIQVRLDRLQAGLVGDVKQVGEGVSELRVDYGPGYRVYFCQKGLVLTIVLAGGNKKTQQRDIRIALELARNL